jgi:hypothetical protein
MQVSSWMRRGAVLAVCLLATVAVGVAPAAARSRGTCRHTAAGRHGARRRSVAHCTHRRVVKHNSRRRAAARTTNKRAVVYGSNQLASMLGDPSVTGASLYGSGSSLQKVAQVGSPAQDWLGLVATWDRSPADEAWSNGAGPGPTGSFSLANEPAVVDYDSTSSGSGLGEFGDSSGSVVLADDSVADALTPPQLDGFIGSDDPPTSSNLENANGASGGVDQVTVPVFQAPIALALSLPNGITVGNGGKINLTNTAVRDIYNDNVPSETNGTTTYPANSWGALLTLAGLTLTSGTPTSPQFTDTSTATGTCTVSTAGTAGGNQCLELEVRNGGSGTTYSIQGFLSISGDSTYNAFSDSEALWPADTTDGCPVGGTGACATSYANGYNVGNSSGNSGSSQLVKNVLADPGTIGYVNLADAATDVGGDAFNDAVQTTTYPGGASPSPSHQYVFAGVQDNYAGSSSTKATYAEPGAVNNVPGPSNTTIIAVTPNVYTGNNINEIGTYSFSQTNVGDWKIAPTNWGRSLGGSVPSDPDVLGHSGAAKYPIIAAT